MIEKITDFEAIHLIQLRKDLKKAINERKDNYSLGWRNMEIIVKILEPLNVNLQYK